MKILLTFIPATGLEMVFIALYMLFKDRLLAHNTLLVFRRGSFFCKTG